MRRGEDGRGTGGKGGRREEVARCRDCLGEVKGKLLNTDEPYQHNLRINQKCIYECRKMKKYINNNNHHGY